MYSKVEEQTGERIRLVGEGQGTDSGLSIYVCCAGILVLMVNTDPIVAFTSHSYR